MSDDKKKPRKPATTLDIDLGGLLGNLGEVLGEAVQKLTEASEAAVDKIHEHKTESGPIRSHSGVRIRMGGLAATSDRKAEAKPSARREAPPPPPPAERPLTCELIEDGAGWLVTAEVPGVGAEEVTLSVQGARLTIRTTGTRRYFGQVDLPGPWPAEAIERGLVNGILTLRGGAE